MISEVLQWLTCLIDRLSSGTGVKYVTITPELSKKIWRKADLEYKGFLALLYFQTVFKNSSVTLNLFIYFFAPWPLFDRSSNSSKCHNFISRCDPRESRKETYHWSFELLLENSINQKPKRSGRGSEFPDWRFFFMIYPN